MPAAPLALSIVHISQENSPTTAEEESPGPLAIGLTVVLALLVVWSFIRWRKRPLPLERLPEVARRQRMKGL
jgi:LPXTG-motif cell wall-anchored protein